MYQFYFEKLEVWQNARALTKDIYQLTSFFSESERFGLVRQLRRAASSVGANIAEGMHRNTVKDKARFINQSFGSIMEVLHFIILSQDLRFVTEADYFEIRPKIERLANQLNALYKSLIKT